MDAKYLQEIKAREQAATAGPWYADGWAMWDDDLDGFVELHDTDPDARFIAHARTDIPALVAEVERLQVENQGLRANSMIQGNIISRGGNPADKDKIVTLIMQNTTLKSEITTLKRALELACDDVDYSCGGQYDVYIKQAQEEQP